MAKHTSKPKARPEHPAGEKEVKGSVPPEVRSKAPPEKPAAAVIPPEPRTDGKPPKRAKPNDKGRPVPKDGRLMYDVSAAHEGKSMRTKLAVRLDADGDAIVETVTTIVVTKGAKGYNHDAPQWSLFREFLEVAQDLTPETGEITINRNDAADV